MDWMCSHVIRNQELSHWSPSSHMSLPPHIFPTPGPCLLMFSESLQFPLHEALQPLRPLDWGLICTHPGQTCLHWPMPLSLTGWVRPSPVV